MRKISFTNILICLQHKYLIFFKPLVPGNVRLGHLLWCSVLVFLNGFCPIWQWFRPPSSVPGPVGSRCAQHRLASTHAPVRCFGAPSKGCPPTMATAVSCHPSQKANGNPVHRAFVVVARVGHAWRDTTQGGGQCYGGTVTVSPVTVLGGAGGGVSQRHSAHLCLEIISLAISCPNHCYHEGAGLF